MRLLTVLAVAAVAAGIYHYRRFHKVHFDAQLARRVRAAIDAAVADPGRVNVQVTRGLVALRGEVPKAERDLVLQAALGVPGVREVANYMESDQAMGEIGPMQSGIATGI